MDKRNISFLKNVFLTFSTRSSLLFFGILISVIIARSLGPEGKGVYNLAILFLSMVIVLTEFGVAPSTVYHSCKKEITPRNAFGISIILSLIIGLVSLLASLVVIYYFGEILFPGVSSKYLYLGAISIPLISFFNYTNSVYLGVKNFQKNNLLKIMEYFFLLLILVTAFFVAGINIKIAILSYALAYLLSNLIMAFMLLRDFGAPDFRINLSIIKKYYNYGGKYYLTNLISFIHLRADAFMINIFLNPASVGIYSIAAGLAEKVWLIPKSVGDVLFPEIASENNEKRIKSFTPVVTRNLMLISVFASLIIGLVGYWAIVILYTDDFIGAVVPFYFLLIGTTFMAGSRTITNDLAGRGKMKEHLITNIFSIFINIIANLIFIPALGIKGAAIGTSISYTLTFFLRARIYCKVSGNKMRDLILPKKSDYKNIIMFISKKRKSRGLK